MQACFHYIHTCHHCQSFNSKRCFLFVSLFLELLKKKKAPGLALKKKFKKNSDFWVYEKKVRFLIRKTIKKQWFYWFVIILVFFNTFAVAVEHYNQPRWLSEFLHITEFFFLGLFIFEMLLRMWALGPRIYFESSFNRFDCLVISGSVFEVVLTHFNPKSGSFGLSVLRALRLLRIFKVNVFFLLDTDTIFN